MNASDSNTLTVWWDGPADGGSNMGADEALAREAERRGSLLLRFYGWSATTVSLGAFQSIAEARRVHEIRGLPLVRRPSGGGAIVHGSDLTYAAAVPKTHRWGAAPQLLYDALHGAMAAVLAHHGIPARPHQQAPGVVAPPADGRGGSDDEPFFCFDRRSAGDLIVAQPGGGSAPKIMGSAQRRLAGVVLQHGSLLLRGNADVSGRARHPGVEDILPGGSMPEASVLAGEWARRIAAGLGADLHEEAAPFTVARTTEIDELSQRFREEWWTGRR